MGGRRRGVGDAMRLRMGRWGGGRGCVEGSWGCGAVKAGRGGRDVAQDGGAWGARVGWGGEGPSRLSGGLLSTRSSVASVCGSFWRGATSDLAGGARLSNMEECAALSTSASHDGGHLGGSRHPRSILRARGWARLAKPCQLAPSLPPSLSRALARVPVSGHGIFATSPRVNTRGCGQEHTATKGGVPVPRAARCACADREGRWYARWPGARARWQEHIAVRARPD